MEGDELFVSPQSSSRTYGSLEDSTGNSLRRWISTTDIQSNQVPPHFWQERDRSRRDRKQWVGQLLLKALAVGGIVTLFHSAYQRLPRTTIRSYEDGDVGSSAKFVGEIAYDVPRVGGMDHTTGPPPPFVEVVSSTPNSPQGELSVLSFTALNFYHERDGKPAADYPWLTDVKLIEPHRETTLAVENSRDGFEYRWEVRGTHPTQADLRETASGSEVVVVLTILDENVIILEEVDPATQVVTRRLEETVMVKYVRREIRTLTNQERGELLDAMHKLWTVKVDGGDGKELYGEDYADIYAINRLHYKAAGALDCDHFHEGLGFLTSHSLLTNTFEYSLQLVNPKLTVPYWDFTIEGSLMGDPGSNSQMDLLQDVTPLFQESWFGGFDRRDNMVRDGRWANTDTQSVYEGNPGGVTPDVYGKLRAPWNMNNRPKLSRGMGKVCGDDVSEFYPWPTCESHYTLATSYGDFYSWVWDSMFDPHGPVHIWIGGVMDCEDTYQRFEELIGSDNAGTLAQYSFVHRKNLYRAELFKCEGTATLDESPEELISRGQCGCPGFDLTQGDDYKTLYDAMMGLDFIIGDYDADTKRQVIAAFCNSTMAIGDHLQAGSSLDPSFWATHPTMERLWMFTVLTGQISDYTWVDSSFTYKDSDGTTVMEEISLYGDGCTGHSGSSVFPFGILDADVDDFTVKTGIDGNPELGNTLSNREVLAALNPRLNSLPYVYDTFKWAHCTGEGFDLNDAWATGEAQAGKLTRSPTFKQGDPRPPMYSSIMRVMGMDQGREERAHGPGTGSRS